MTQTNVALLLYKIYCMAENGSTFKPRTGVSEGHNHFCRVTKEIAEKPWGATAHLFKHLLLSGCIPTWWFIPSKLHPTPPSQGTCRSHRQALTESRSLERARAGLQWVGKPAPPPNWAPSTAVRRAGQRLQKWPASKSPWEVTSCCTSLAFTAFPETSAGLPQASGTHSVGYLLEGGGN